MKQIYIRSLLTIAFLTTLIYVVYTGWYSVMIFWLLGLFVGLGCCKFFFLKHYTNLRNIFIFAYCFYSLYMYITNFIYVKDPDRDFFMIVDSMRFWSNSNFKMYSVDDVIETFKQQLTVVYKYPLFNLGSLLIAFVANAIDANNIVVQKFQSVFLGSFSMIYVYLIFLKYFGTKKALKYTLFFSVCSFVCIYSVVFNRDPHVYFLYTAAAYLIVYHKQQKFVLLKLVILMALTAGFRLEHGLFFILYFIIYFYLKSRSKYLFVTAGILLVPIFYVMTSDILAKVFLDTTEHYEGRRDAVDRTAGSSFGASFAELPHGIKEPILAVNGQLAPAIPFWRNWYMDPNNPVMGADNILAGKSDQPGYFTPWRFMESIAAIISIYIWGFIIMGFFRKLYKNIPYEIWGLFVFAILLLLATTSSLDARRVYCVYMHIFLLALVLYNRMDKKLKRLVFKRTTLFLVIIYLGSFVVRGHV